MMFAQGVWSFVCGKTDYQIANRSFSSNLSVNLQTSVELSQFTYKYCFKCHPIV